MSDTLANVRVRCRRLFDDTNPNDYVIGDLRLNDLIDGATQDIGGRVPQGQAWVTSAVTLVAGTADYALPTAEYSVIHLVRGQAYGWLLRKLTPHEMERRRQSPAGSIAQGVPEEYSLIENTGQTVTIRLFPIPSAADALDILRSVNPAALSSDSDTVPFGRQLLRAVECMAAGRAIRSMSDDLLAKRSITRTLGDDLLGRAETLIRNEVIRQTRERRVSRITLEAR